MDRSLLRALNNLMARKGGVSRLRRAITLENVLVTIVAFAVLSGGVAYAAGHLAKNSVGTKQLKKNAVTVAKIKKNAVTTAKIKAAAVTGGKVQDGAIGAAAFDPTTNPFSGVVATITGGPGTVQVSASVDTGAIPLANPAFVQQPGEIDYVVGQAQVGFGGGCISRKVVDLEVAYDSPEVNSTTFDNRLVAEGFVFDSAGSLPNPTTVPLTFTGAVAIPKVAVPTNRTLSLTGTGQCVEPGTLTVSNVKLEVIGVKG